VTNGNDFNNTGRPNADDIRSSTEDTGEDRGQNPENEMDTSADSMNLSDAPLPSDQAESPARDRSDWKEVLKLPQEAIRKRVREEWSDESMRNKRLSK
jgi:hypothetical protein